MNTTHNTTKKRTVPSMNGSVPSLKLLLETVGEVKHNKCTVKATVQEIVLTERLNLDESSQRRKAAKSFVQMFADREITVGEKTVLRELENLAGSKNDTKAMEINSSDVDLEAVLKALGIQVIMTNDRGSIWVYTLTDGRTHEIPDIERFTESRFRQIIGAQKACLVFNPEKNSPFSFNLVKKAIATAANKAPFRDSLASVGQGIHSIDGSVLLVNGNKAFLVDTAQNTLKPLRSPVFKSALIDGTEKSWCPGFSKDYQNLAKEEISKAYNMLVNHICGDRSWKHEKDPHVIASLIIATHIQDAFQWRPMVGFTGPTESGKTFLFEKIELLLGKGADIIEDPTEAGLRQKMLSNKLPVLIDEFDSCRRKAKILELFRSSGHGGTIVRGTQNHKAQEFHIRHIVWIAGIQLGMFKEQDFNRFIRIDLLPLEKVREYKAPSEKNMAELSRRLIAASLQIMLKAVKLAKSLAKTPIKGITQRMVQNYAVPAAVHTVATCGQDCLETGRKILEEMLVGREMPEILTTGTHQELLKDILYSTVKTERGYGGVHEQTIGDLIGGCGNAAMKNPTLYKYGLKIVSTKQGDKKLFIVPKIVIRFLLKNTEWEKMELGPILMQLPGVERSQQRFSDHLDIREWGYTIPLSSLNDNEQNSIDDDHDEGDE